MDPGAQSGGRARRLSRALRRRAPLVLFVAAIAAYYVFLVSTGTWSHWHTWTAFYDAQAEGLRAGHLYLREAPSRTLQSLRAPLDPANIRFWRWDHSYYRGHLYVYWGLVPALLLAAIKVALRVRATVSDDVLVFVFVVGRLLAGTLLLRAMAARLDPKPRGWAVGLALLVFALAHPTPYTLARAGIYEAAITGGVFFMLSGLWLGFRALCAAPPRAAYRWMAPAGLCFGLAAGCRVSLLPVAAALTLYTAVARWRVDGGHRRRLLGPILAVGLPAAGVTLAHFALNRLRFGAWTEYGATYQMGYPPLRLSPRFLLVDLYAHFVCPPWHSCELPFLSARWNTTRLLAPGWLRWPADHHANEPTIGLLLVVPFLWLLGAAIFRRVRQRPASPPLDAPARWLWGALAIYTLGSLLPIVLLSATTMRYQLDFVSGLLLLATSVGWRLLGVSHSPLARRTCSFLYGTLAAATIAAGLLLGLSGYFDAFAHFNPQLLHRLQATLSLCRPR